MFRGIFASGGRARGTRRHACQDTIDIVGATPNEIRIVRASAGRSTDGTPFLMCEDITANLLFFSLDKVDICEHAVSFIACSQFS